MSHRTKITWSLILVICLLLSGIPVVAVDGKVSVPVSTMDSTVVPSTSMTVEENPVLQLESDCQILQYVDEEVFQDSAHIARLTNEETLDTYVFLNEDGSKTVYYMDEPVRFIDANGTVKEKDLTLTAVGDGYTTTQNDIQLTIPTDPADGIHLIYDNHYISLIPQGGTLSAAVQITDSSVTYPDYYGEGMSLRYSPTLSGVKEDILLNAYTGINSFIFRLNTGGLNLYQVNGRYFLAKSKMSTDRIELGNVVTYDARGRFSVGTMTAQTIMAGQAYLLTLTVEEDFLTDENTTYPVTIDPTLTVSDNSHGAGAIEDATVYEGQPSLNTGTWPYNHVGYYDDTYGMGHTVVRLKGLLEDSTYAAVDADKILSAEFHIKEASGNTDGRIYLYPMYSNTTWTESGITWNNKGSYIGSAYDSVVLGNGETASFDITNLIKDWKNGVRNANAGFILDASSSNTAVKAIYASEHSTTGNRPYVTVTYAGRITLSGPLDVDEGETITLTAVTEPAGEAVIWKSSDSSVATVSGGVVTGLKAGKVSITATLSDGTYASRTIYVTIPDGVYRISQGSLYLGTSGSIADHTEAHLIAKSEDGLAQLSQLWKVKYITNGYYTIRPMHKLNMALDSTSGTVDIVSDGGNDALLGGSFSNRWGISYGSGGYVFKSANSDLAAMKCTAIYPGADILTDTYSVSNSTFHWTLDSSHSGIVLYDAQSKSAYLSPPTISVFLNSPQTLSNHNMLLVAYADSNNLAINWHSDKPDVVSVDSDTGLFTGNTSGLATITGEVSLGNSSQKAVFYVRVKQAFSGGGEFYNGNDVIAAAQSWADCDYYSWYNTNPEITTLDESYFNSDIVYFSTHGAQHLIAFENDMTLTDAIIATSNTSRSIEEMTLNNSVLYIYDACNTASNLDDTGKNLCTATIDAGADCVIGWTKSIYSSDSFVWQQRFQAKLCEGNSVINAANYANTFIYDDNESIKSWRLYGDQTMVITAASATMTTSTADKNYIDVASSTEAGRVYSENTSMQLLQQYFGESNLASTDSFVPSKTYTTDDSSNYVVDFIVYRGQYALDSGYTIIVENHKIVGIRNNMDSYVASNIDISAATGADFDIIKDQAYEEALNRMYSLSPNYSVIEQSYDLYFDCDTSTRYCRVYTEYCTPTGACGAFITLYPTDHGGNEYEA